MDNLLLRSAKDSDLEAIHLLAQDSGFGLTTLPKERTILAQRLEHATASFEHIRHTPGNEYYLFVLEDPKNKQVVGTAAIEACIGVDTPFYAYKVSRRIKTVRKDFKNQHNDELLFLVNDHQGQSELCTLYLKPEYRKEHCGAFLSRARFLFLAQFPSHFSEDIVAEMRGVTSSDGSSPFWNALGYHFFHLPFVEADRLTLSTDKQFIADFMPEYPIYVKLLPKAAQKAIGQPHESTKPAMHLLLNEGFYYNRYVDIFDAGPMLEAKCSHIKTVKNSTLWLVDNIQKNICSESSYLVSNTDINFRATRARIKLNSENNTCIITHKTAALLEVSPGAAVRVALF